MDEITLSVMRNNQQTEPALRRLLDRFERLHGIRVRLQVLLWDNARQEVKNFAIHQRGPDVSAIGTTWISDLVAMNALQPLDQVSAHPLGSPAEFVPAAWDTALSGAEKRIVAAPWLVDTYVIHYRHDLFEQAGIDPSTAFTSHAQIDDTVRRLSQAGLTNPFQLPYHYDRFCTQHSLAAWVWGHGGEFCTPDGSRVLFDQPEALAGIREYFSLARHLTPEARTRLAGPDSFSLFRQGQAAAAFGTLSLMYDPQEIPARVRENWRAAPIPGPHFVGGVNLVMWKYSMRDKAALELIRYLNGPEEVAEIAQAMLTSPARLSVLEGRTYAQDALLRVISASARSGRTYPAVRLWGLIEERLIGALSTLGSQVLQPASPDLDQLLQDNIKPIARRLNVTLTP